jgi:hypothetical protein
MLLQRQRLRPILDRLVELLVGAALLCAPAEVRAGDKLSLYAYSDTRALVSLVEEAAGLVERNGEQAFRQFAVKGSKWLNGDIYFFAYLVDGTCVFHPITRQEARKRRVRLGVLSVGEPDPAHADVEEHLCPQIGCSQRQDLRHRQRAL